MHIITTYTGRVGFKYSINKEFFKKWSHNMAYVLGFIYADGSMEDSSYMRGKYLRMTSTDLCLISKIKEVMEAEHKLISCKDDLSKRKTRYLLRIGDKDIYSDLKKIGLTPNKSKNMQFPTISYKFMSDFVRGYFDGDGCVSVEFAKNSQNKRILKRLVTVFTSGSVDFLNSLSDELTLIIGYKKKIFNSHRSFQLRFSTTDSISLFKYMYGYLNKDSLFLRRKVDVFSDYFRLRSNRIDNDCAHILNSISDSDWLYS